MRRRAPKGSVKDRAAYLRTYRREWVANRRAAFFEGKTCVKCGASGNLELDHIDPSTKWTHRIWSSSAKKFEEEVSKCQVLCHQCHREKSNGELRRPLVHGTLSGYKRHKCRCEECRAANRSNQARWRAERTS